MTGPAPKSADRRQRPKRGNAHRVTVSSPALPDILPKPPAGLLKSTQAEWAGYWSSAVSAAVDLSSDRPAIDRLFSLYDERRRAFNAYKKNRMVRGSQGQPVLNPMFRAMALMDTEIRALEDRVGLTPKARAMLGIALGDAKKSLSDLNRELEVEAVEVE